MKVLAGLLCIAFLYFFVLGIRDLHRNRTSAEGPGQGNHPQPESGGDHHRHARAAHDDDHYLQFRDTGDGDMEYPIGSSDEQ